MHPTSDTTNYVCKCNRTFGAETLHPLVSLIDMSAPCAGSHVKTDCYAVVLKRHACDCARYGRRYYDYSDATLLFTAPHKEIDLCTNDGTLLIFHPELIRCTPLGMRLKEYSFFKYRPDESLHISCCEEKCVSRCLESISNELCRGVDEYSKTIISSIIDLLLTYCRRFYNRQFITRHNANVDAIKTLDGIIDRCFESGTAAAEGMPTAVTMAQQLGMSAAYLDDMLKNETGKTVSQYVQLRRMALAKQMLMAHDRTESEIAGLLGFSTEKLFATVFKRITGCTPDEYRNG